MNMKELQRNWELFGRTDPLRAILTGPPAAEGWRDEEFFRCGQVDVDAAFAVLEQLDAVPKRERALDFGCGVGRLTQALCERFDSVVGVDIAPAMVELARRYNRFGRRCEYMVNDRDDLSLFPDRSFDFVFSLIVLQHMKPKYSMRYVEEFLRITAPGGIIVFQVPAAMKNKGHASLPRKAFRAHIEQLHPTEAPLHAGERRRLAVRVTNASGERWADSDGGPVLGLYLGNHWLSERGKVAVMDDARAALPTQLDPGDTVELELTVTAPARPGRYILQLDLVQEGVRWFAQRGSPTCRSPLEVRPAPGGLDAALAHDKPGAAPRMEMHCVPRAAVEQLVKRRGGEVLGVYPHHGAGPEFENYQYFVRVPLQAHPRRTPSRRQVLGAARALLRRAFRRSA